MYYLLIEWLILTYSNENAIVFDGCMGGGTTAVAAIETNRNFIGFEIEKAYCEIAQKSLDKLNYKNCIVPLNKE